MAKLDIFNRALKLLGHDRTIPDISSTMTENVRCEQEWDGARLAVLSAQDWNWLVEETPLAEGAECLEDYTDTLEYQTARPDDIIRLIAVLDGENKTVDYRAANEVIYTSVEEIKFRYLADSTDPDDWPQCIVDAVCYELAARVALAMTANAKVVNSMNTLAKMYLNQAKLQDSSEQKRHGTDGDKYAQARR